MANELTTRISSLHQAIDGIQEIEYWRPEPKDSLVGILQGLRLKSGHSGQDTCSWCGMGLTA
jgi:hypothetical protein